MEEDQQASGHIVVIDGHVVHTDLDTELLARGVILSSLHDAIEQHSDLVSDYLSTGAVPAEEGKFAALNAALWSDGIFLCAGGSSTRCTDQGYSLAERARDCAIR